ncbi:MAG: type IV secretory system conjugative DNA transfer family protein, partial [Flavobacterium sp.]
MSGFGLGEVSSLGGLVFKIVKSVLMYSLIFSVILIETHLFGFAITNLFVHEYSFELQKLNPITAHAIYNNLLYLFSTILVKMNTFQNIAIIIFVPSIVYCSYFHTKQKKFPNVIIGTIVNNTIAFLILALLVKLSIEAIGLWSILFYSIPVFYAFYLLKFKTKVTDSKSENFKIEKKAEVTEGFTFQTNKGTIYLENPYRGIYIQGGAGSGKSASIFEPIIKQIGEKQFSGILYDYKSPELTEKVYLSYEASTIKVKNIDFKHPFLSDRVNPINPKYLLKSSIAIEYAQVIINNLLPETIKKSDFWSNNAKMILAGVIWYLRFVMYDVTGQ